MASVVFVCPLTLVSGVYADLHGGNPITNPFEMMHATLDNNGDIMHQVTLMFDFETPLVPEGRIRVHSTSGRFTGGGDADCDAAVAFVEALWNEHHLFLADFNLVAISENRALFNSMRQALTSYCNKYAVMQECLIECRIRMSNLRSEVSSWLGMRHDSVTLIERAVVSAFHASLKLQYDTVGEDVRHAYQLIQLLNYRGAPPEAQERLDATYPMPMEISWERSYYVLRTIYDEAIKKIPGDVSLIKVLDTEHGQLKATVDVSCVPYFFCGAPASTRGAAKPKLFYVVIKHVNRELAHPIIDLHHDVKQYPDSFVARYDRHTVDIFCCAEKLKQLLDSTATMFEQSSTELSAKLSANPCSNVLFEELMKFGTRLVVIRDRFNDQYSQFSTSRADRK